jgi:hypothetical protein
MLWGGVAFLLGLLLIFNGFLRPAIIRTLRKPSILMAICVCVLADSRGGPCRCHRQISRSDDDVLFIGTRFSNLYTAVDTPA